MTAGSAACPRSRPETAPLCLPFEIFRAVFYDFVDIFAVEADSEPALEDTLPIAALQFGQAAPTLDVVPGSYDIYLTPLAERDTILAGPIRIDLAIGDVVQAIVLDVVDPELAELVIFPEP